MLGGYTAKEYKKLYRSRMIWKKYALSNKIIRDPVTGRFIKG